MRRAMLVGLMLTCLALTAPGVAQARGGLKTPALSVPPDWPASIPVPVGKIRGVSRDLAGNVTLTITAPDPVVQTVTMLDQLYRQAGFRLDPASTNPRYLTRDDCILTAFFGSHDERLAKTDLVVRAIWIAPSAAPAPASLAMRPI